MRMKKFTIGLVGIILLGMAIFAKQMGIDNDSEWGKGRIIIFGLGIILISVNFLSILFQSQLLKLAKRTSDLFKRFNELNYSSQLVTFSVVTTVAVIAIYIWLFLPFWRLSPTSNFYSQLAIAFKRNQLYLPEQPPPSLLALSDPYDYESRKQIDSDFTWDVSLYNGKFYMYWGPVPSLFLTLFSNEQLSHLGDQYVFFLFICGLFIYSALFLASFWNRFNHSLPTWTISICLLAIGLSGPTIWLFTRPRIYEAAVVGCQFFFIGGCYWAYSAMKDNSPNLWKLALASSHWALALGTRILIVPVIIFLTGLTLIYHLRTTEMVTFKKKILTILALIAPIFITLTGLGLYNWLRFDSIFEFGLRYQLASVNYKEFTNLFSARYIDDNFFNYFIQPFKIQSKFPYLRPIENVASSERLAGLLYTTPFFLFVLIPMGRFLYLSLTSRKIPIVNPNTSAQRSWLVTALTGSALISLAIILSYYFVALRFAEDFMPATLLIAIIWFGQGYDLFAGNRILSKSYLLFATLLVVFSVIASVLIAIPINRTGYALLLIKYIQQFLGVR